MTKEILYDWNKHGVDGSIEECLNILRAGGSSQWWNSPCRLSGDLCHTRITSDHFHLICLQFWPVPSMAGGEYVSVSTQKDTEEAVLWTANQPY